MTNAPRWTARFARLAALLVGMALISWLAWAPSAQRNSLAALDGQTRTLTLGGERFVVELASTPPSQELGLMHRRELPSQHGMLFLYAEEAPRAFWMKNVHFALDILFLDADWRIVHRVVAAPPCLDIPCEIYPTPQPAQYVLELPAGSIDRLGLSAGQRVASVEALPLRTK